MSTDTLTTTDITGDYTLDASHSRLGFSARHAMVTKVRGQFGDFEGTARIDTADPAASHVEVIIRPPRSAPAVRTATTTCAPATSSTSRASRPGPSPPPTSAAAAPPGPSPAP